MKHRGNDSSGHEHEKKRGSPPFFYGIHIAWLLVVILVAYIFRDVTIGSGEASVSFSVLFIAVMMLWIAFSIQKVDEDEVAGVYLWGIPMINTGPGPKILLRGIFSMATYPASVQQNQFPAEPELIQKTPDDVPLQMVLYTHPDGLQEWILAVRPLRITTRGPDGTGQILDAQMSLEFTFWVRWVIEDALDFTIAAHGSTTKERIREAVRQMRDSGESVLNEEVVGRTPATIISDFSKVHSALKERIRRDVFGWGIRIIDVGLTSPDLSRDVSKALARIPEANANAQAAANATRQAADAESYRLEKEGQGRGKAKTAELVGEGQGYKEAAELMGVTPRELLEAQVARDTIGEADVILGTQGVAEAIGLGKFILEKANERKGGDPRSTV